MTSAARARNTVVVGGGVNGLAAAWQLASRGAGTMTLVERFRVGHDRGSSHGASRITRTSYRDPGYVRLVRAAQREDWPRLERDAATRLVHPAPGVFFGPAGGQIDDYARAVAAAGAPVERVHAAEARRRFPQFAFPDDPAVLVDSSAGVIAAAETVAALARLASAAGVEFLEETRVLRVTPHPDRIDVETDRGTIAAARVVVTAGAWVARLLPRLAPRLAVARQTVCWFEGDGDPAAFRAPRFPVWVWLGRDEHDHVYGLPEFGRAGIKAARHVTSPEADDPEDAAGTPPRALLDDVEGFLARELSAPPRRLLAWERCLYTNEARQDFVIGPLPDEPRIVVGAACSGHAFKFAPLTGRVLADLALGGRSSCPEFEAMRDRLAVT